MSETAIETRARCEIGLFKEDRGRAAAQGHFDHVFVDRESRAPAPIPEGIRAALERIRTTA